MATRTSDRGKFDLTAIGVNPSPVAYGEPCTLSVTLKNRTGAAITALLIDAQVTCRNALTPEQEIYNPEIDPYVRFYLRLYGNPDVYWPETPISWANGAEHTFTFTGAFAHNYGPSMWDIRDGDGNIVGEIDVRAPDLSGRTLNPGDRGGLTLTIVYVNRNGDFQDDFSDDLSGGFVGDVPVLSHRWSPTVPTLAVHRGVADGGGYVAGDEGERLMVTSGLAMSAHADPSRMFCRLYYANDPDVDMSDSYIDLMPSLSALLAGVTDDASLVTRTFSNGLDWYFLLAFGDAWETAVAPASIARAFANLHLSGASTGGAAFGRFSSSAEGNPKLESEYPIYAYGGIEGVTNYAAGEVSTGGRWIDGKPIYRYVFDGTVTLSERTTVATLPSTVDTMIRGTMIAGGQPIPFTNFSDAGWNTAWYLHGSKTLIVQAGAQNRAARRIVFILEYTRADDTAT